MVKLASALIGCGKSETSISSLVIEVEDNVEQRPSEILKSNTGDLIQYSNNFFQYPQYFKGTYSPNDHITEPQINDSYSEMIEPHFKYTTDHVTPAKDPDIASLQIHTELANETLIERWKPGETGNKISFSFYTSGLSSLSYNDYGSYPEDLLFTFIYENKKINFSEEQKVNIRKAFGEFSKVLDVEFVEVTETEISGGTIRLGITSTEYENVAAVAKSPGHYWSSSGDIWFFDEAADTSFQQGSDYHFRVALHEIGHAMGLAHPFETGQSGKPAISEALDYRNFTVMSYTDPIGAQRITKNGYEYTISNTLMVYDIKALQEIYGINSDFNDGNTYYFFDNADPFMSTLWDASGEDLLDLSNFAHSCTISLVPGTYSTLPFTHGNYSELLWEGRDNLGIAFDCVIENVIGGSGSDLIYGNSFDNELSGGPGDDVIYGYAGDDIFDVLENARGGNDTFYGGIGDDTYFFGEAGTDLAFEYFNEGTDTVWVSDPQNPIKLNDNIENIYATDMKSANFHLVGNELDNGIKGSKNSNDKLTGGDGSDVFLMTSFMGHDKVLDFDFSENDQIYLHALDREEISILRYENNIILYTPDGSSLELINPQNVTI